MMSLMDTRAPTTFLDQFLDATVLIIAYLSAVFSLTRSTVGHHDHLVLCWVFEEQKKKQIGVDSEATWMITVCTSLTLSALSGEDTRLHRPSETFFFLIF
jgi:hypothetical protein